MARDEKVVNHCVNWLKFTLDIIMCRLDSQKQQSNIRKAKTKSVTKYLD